MAVVWPLDGVGPELVSVLFRNWAVIGRNARPALKVIFIRRVSVPIGYRRAGAEGGCLLAVVSIAIFTTEYSFDCFLWSRGQLGYKGDSFSRGPNYSFILHHIAPIIVTMGVLRFPRPTGIYVPNSSTPPTLTTDMISPPLSPTLHEDTEAVTASIIPALDYISSKLQQRMLHVTLLVGRGTPFPAHPASDQMMVIPVTSLDESSWRLLYRIIAKAVRKFALGTSWADALARSQHERHVHWYLIQQSIRQNEVLFSREGLTLLNMDRIYTFKRRLCILSRRSFAVSDDNDPYIASCVHLLHRTIADFQGRPFSKAFFHRVYEQLDVCDDLLTRVAHVYCAQYEQEGIVLPQATQLEKMEQQQQQQQQSSAQAHTNQPRRMPIRTVRRRVPPVTSTSPKQAKRGPKTPVSASDVTPITRNEWNLLVGGGGICRGAATVTKWTPSPTVLAVG